MNLAVSRCGAFVALFEGSGNTIKIKMKVLKPKTPTEVCYHPPVNSSGFGFNSCL